MTVYRVESVGVRMPSADGPREILRDVTFAVATGEIVGIVGRSGAGKTTLLRVLGGLHSPTCGSVSIFGRPVTRPPDGVVMVFQDYGNALLPWRTVARNTALGVERNVGRAARRAKVDRALQMVGLFDRSSDYPEQLSGGMAQRVQIARALAVEPAVLLMDEPFGALDALTKSALQDVLLNVHQQTGTTIVFITHDLDEAIYLSDRVVVLNGEPGVVVLTIETELPRPRDQFGTRESARYLEVRHLLGRALRGDDD